LDFAFASKEALDLADRHCAGRLVSVLEGGYNISALKRCILTHVTELANH